jgi:hypothetical protein
MSKSLPIPVDEQLEAVAGGLRDVYRLLGEYLGDLNSVPNFRQYITITKSQRAGYLRARPELSEKHVARASDARYHESPVLEWVNGRYRVYEIDHGQPRYMTKFANLADAAAEYLMWGW